MSRAKDFDYTEPEIVKYDYGVERQDLTPFLSIVYVNGTFQKRFQGETAWSDAQRYALDLVTQEMIKEW